MADWRRNLNKFFAQKGELKESPEESEFTNFLEEKALPAFEEIAAELEKYGREVTMRNTPSSATLVVCRSGEEELMYRLHGRRLPNKVLPCAEVRFRERKGRRRITVESMFKNESSDYTITDLSTEDVINNFLENYTQRVEADHAHKK